MSTLEAVGVVVNPDFGITHVVGLTPSGKARLYPVREILAFIAGGNQVYTAVGERHTPVYVVNGPLRRAYIRTQANESVEDNLLSLPRY
jgi:hypothetical protein